MRARGKQCFSLPYVRKLQQMPLSAITPSRRHTHAHTSQKLALLSECLVKHSSTSPTCHASLLSGCLPFSRPPTLWWILRSQQPISQDPSAHTAGSGRWRQWPCSDRASVSITEWEAREMVVMVVVGGSLPRDNGFRSIA